MSNTRPIGFCRDCRVAPAAPKPDGTLASRCADCALKRAAALKAARAAAKSKGLCAWEGGNCSRKAVEGRRYCKAHLQYHRERMTPPS